MHPVTIAGTSVQREGGPIEKLFVQAEEQEAIRREIRELRSAPDRVRLLLEKILHLRSLPQSEFATQFATFKAAVIRAGLKSDLEKAVQEIQAATRRNRPLRLG